MDTLLRHKAVYPYFKEITVQNEDISFKLWKLFS